MAAGLAAVARARRARRPAAEASRTASRQLHNSARKEKRRTAGFDRGSVKCQVALEAKLGLSIGPEKPGQP